MTTSDTPAVAPTSKRLKTLTLEVPSFEVGPEGVPIFYGTDESPVIIRGRVIFHTQHECKGSRVVVLFSAVENVEWRVSAGNMDRIYLNRQEFKIQEFKLKLPHLPVTEEVDPTSGKTITVGAKNRVSPGTYSLDFTVRIDPHFPSSAAGYCGKMVYKLRATLIRDFPSSDIVCKQRLWVLNSHLPPPTNPLEPYSEAMTWRVYSSVFEGDIKYKCYLPSYPICLGYPFVMWLRLESVDPQQAGSQTITSNTQTQTSTLSSSNQPTTRGSRKRPTTKIGSRAGRPFKVPKGSAVILEKRWYLSSGGYQHFTRRKIHTIDLIKEQDQYPHPSRNGADNTKSDGEKGENEGENGVTQTRTNINDNAAQSRLVDSRNSTRWSKMVMIQVPNVWAINPDSRTTLITTQHVLTVKLDVRYGFLSTRTMNFDVPLVIQVPRPPSCPSNRHDLIPSVLGL